MRTIYKYLFDSEHGEFEIELPDGAELLAVDTQEQEPCMWFIVETSKAPTKRRFFTAFTGARLADWCNKSNHVGTLQLRRLVLHVFMKPV